MGMRIDDEIYVHGYLDEIRQDKVIIRNEGGYFGTVVDELVEVIQKADYKNRLKADMVAMLTELQLEIENLYPEHQCTGELTGFADAIETITPIIQQKIDKLKGEENSLREVIEDADSKNN